jgi:hypothetical protein
MGSFCEFDFPDSSTMQLGLAVRTLASASTTGVGRSRSASIDETIAADPVRIPVVFRRSSCHWRAIRPRQIGFVLHFDGCAVAAVKSDLTQHITAS